MSIGAGKGPRPRYVNKEQWDACPLWANLEKKKMEEKQKQEQLEKDQMILTPNGEKEASGSAEVFMDKTPEEGKPETGMDKLANLHGD